MLNGDISANGWQLRTRNSGIPQHCWRWFIDGHWKAHSSIVGLHATVRWKMGLGSKSQLMLLVDAVSIRSHLCLSSVCTDYKDGKGTASFQWEGVCFL